jgi:hypothetical protein
MLTSAMPDEESPPFTAKHGMLWQCREDFLGAGWVTGFGGAGVAIPPLRTLPKPAKIEIVQRAVDSIIWTPRRIFLCGVRFALPVSGALAVLYLFPHNIYIMLAGLAFIWFGQFLAVRYEMSLVIPAVRRELGGICTACGYDLRGNVSGICPECGCKIETSAAPPVKRREGRNFARLGIAIFGAAAIVGCALLIFGNGQKSLLGLLLAGTTFIGVVLCVFDLSQRHNE